MKKEGFINAGKGARVRLWLSKEILGDSNEENIVALEPSLRRGIFHGIED